MVQNLQYYNFKQTGVLLEGLTASMVLYIACYVHYVTHVSKFHLI